VINIKKERLWCGPDKKFVGKHGHCGNKPYLNSDPRPFILTRNDSFEDYSSRFKELLNDLPCELLKYKDLQDSVLDIFNKISPLISKDFLGFYSRLPIKNPKYFLACLVYLDLISKNIKINKKDIYNLFELDQSNFSRFLSFISDFIKTSPNLELYSKAILRYSRASTLNGGEFFSVVFNYIEFFLKDLSLSNYYEEVELFVNNNFNWNDVHSFKAFYHSLSIKTPKLISAVICFYYLEFKLDKIIDHKDFINFLNEKNANYTLNIAKFNTLYRQLLMDYFTFDLDEYKNKVKKYLEYYIQNINNNIILFDLDDTFSDYCLQILDYSLENNFKIIWFSGAGIHYYYPKLMASSLIFYVSRTTKGLESLLTLNNNSNFIDNYEYVANISLNRLYPYIKDFIGRWKGQSYSRQDFITKLLNSLNDKYNPTTEFILELFNLSPTTITPNDFIDYLGIYNTDLAGLLDQIINKHGVFIKNKTYRKIVNYINMYLTQNSRKYALKLLQNLRKVSYKIFYHRNAVYNFEYIEERILNIHNPRIKDVFLNFFGDIQMGNFPIDLFQDPNNYRVSDLKIQGNVLEKVYLNVIENHLIRKNLNIYQHPLCQLAQHKINNYISKYRISPRHPQILNFLLNKYNKAIGIEVPVWVPILNSLNLFYIGDIDFIFISYNNGNYIVNICDYKNDENEIIRSLPQINSYGILFKKCLSTYGIPKNTKIKCIGFCGDISYEFDPFVFRSDLIETIEKINEERNMLLTIRRSNDYILDILKNI